MFVFMFGVGLSTVLTVIKFEFNTTSVFDKISPIVLVSDWSAAAEVIVFMIVLPLVLALTVAVISKETFAFAFKSPIVQSPVVLL